MSNIKTSNGLKLIIGTEGDDILAGTPGIDIIKGLDGDDIIEGKQGVDTIDGGEGLDTVRYTSSNEGVTVDLSSGTGSKGDAEGDKLSNIENIIGSRYDDVLVSRDHKMTAANGNEFLISTNTENNQKHPSISSLTNGGFVVVWESHMKTQPRTDGIFGQIYDTNGQKLGDEFQVNTYIKGNQLSPSVAKLVEGGFIVTWQSTGQDGSAYGIYGQCYAGDGKRLGNEFQVNSYTTNRQERPAVASLTTGGFIVAWESLGQDGSGWGAYGQRYDKDGNKADSEFQINTYTKDHQHHTSVAGFAEGGFIVTWLSKEQDRSSYYSAYAQRFDTNGQKLGNELKLDLVNAYNSYSNTHQQPAPVVELAGGGFIVTLHNDRADVHGQCFDTNGQKLKDSFQVNSYIYNDQQNPTIASFGANGFIITWQSEKQDDSSWGIYGQHYDARGNRIDGEFKINTHTQDSQNDPAIASLPNRRFIVVWESNAQNNDSDEAACTNCSLIYGQLYKPNFYSFLGGHGDDVLKPREGADILDGGIGIDTVDYSGSNIGVIINLALGIGQVGYAEGDILKNIEHVIGSSHEDVIIGDDGANILYGGGDDDILYGGLGPDIFVLNKGSGSSTIKDFELDKDKIEVRFIDVNSFEDLLSKADYIDGNTEISSLSYFNKWKMVLTNIRPDLLQRSHFIFGNDEDSLIVETKPGPGPEHEPEAESSKATFYIAKAGQQDKIVITREAPFDPGVKGTTGLEQCRNIILNFNPAGHENERDTIDLSQYGKFRTDQVSFTTFTKIATIPKNENPTPVSGIKISGEADYLVCAYGFDADKFFAPDYVDPDGISHLLEPHNVVTLTENQLLHEEL